LRYFLPAPQNYSLYDRLSHERNRRILFSSIAGSIGKFCIALIGLVTIPMAVRYLGKDQYAIWMIVTSVVVWMQLADFGVGNGLTNALAEANGRDDFVAASGYLSTSLATASAFALFLIPIFYVSIQLISWGWLFNISDPRLAGMAGEAMLVAGIAFIINIPLSLVGRVYIAYQKAYVTSLSQVLVSALTLLGLWLGIHAELSLPWLVGIVAFMPVLGNFILWFFFISAKVSIGIALKNIRKNYLKRVISSSVPLFFLQCGVLLVNEFVIVIIAHLGTLSMVTDFSLIQRIYLFGFTLAAAVSTPFYPAIREAFERGDSLWVVRAIRNSILYRFLALVPIILILIIYGDNLVERWIGGAIYNPIGILGWFCVVLCMCLFSLSAVFAEVLTFLDDVWTQVALTFLMVPIVFFVMYWLIPLISIPGIYLAFGASVIFPIAWSFYRLRTKIKASV
jgi:O-antigen/teichoic acid export membrane protein